MSCRCPAAVLPPVQGSKCEDYCAVFCCPLCALVQERNQVQDWEALHVTGGVDDLLIRPNQATMRY